MKKRFAVIFVLGLFLLSIYGCALLLAGAAGGAGASIWLSGKLSVDCNASYDRTVMAAKRALESLKLDITKETKEDNVTQIKSKYFDGREVWIDIRRISDTSSKVEVRVGAASDKEAADKILKKIVRAL